jgi:hypothetical protein
MVNFKVVEQTVIAVAMIRPRRFLEWELGRPRNSQYWFPSRETDVCVCVCVCMCQTRYRCSNLLTIMILLTRKKERQILGKQTVRTEVDRSA